MPAARDAVAADKGIEQAFRDPVMEIRDEILTLGPPALHAHQIAAIAGHDGDDDPVDGKLLLPEDAVELFHTVALVQQIVDQNDGPVERAERAHLIRQRRIIRVFLDRKAAHVGRVAFFHVERLRDRIGDNGVREDLSVGHAHIRPQLPHALRHILHAVHALDALGNGLIEHFRVEAQKELAGEHGAERHAKAGAGL